MQKIDFVNSQQPAINDTNLNLMQTYIENAIQGAVSGDTLPVGVPLPFAGGTVPDNYLLCNGQAVSRTEYAQLFSVIGTYWGVGDGSTTFNIPDLRGKTFFGYDANQTEFNAIGKTSGAKAVTLTKNNLPAGTVVNESGSIHIGTESGTVLSKTTAATAMPILNPYGTGLWIIKAFQTAGVVAEVVNQYSTSTTNVYSANYINPQAIYCRLNSEVVTNTSGYQNITNWASQNSVGSSFTIQNGQVKIPAGVTKVKVTTKLRAYHLGTEALYSFITKNSTNESSSWTVDDVNGYLTIYNQAIVDVQENDLISANVYGNAIYLQASSTTMIVEKIA